MVKPFLQTIVWTSNTHMTNRLLSLAYYLPQFHEIEENNRWWGPGFTEWQQLNSAKTYFDWQHIQKPKTPFGDYNLLNPAVFDWQQSVAQTHGIDGFLVFDYWFGEGKKLLEKPMQMVLDHQLDFKYAFCWANHTWYNKRENITLQLQQYLGAEDYTAYFEQLLPHFHSANYIKVEGKPVFSIFSPKEIPDLEVFIQTFNKCAAQHGFAGIYWLADNTEPHQPWKKYFDGYNKSGSIFKWRKRDSWWSYIREKLARTFHYKQLGPFVYNYHGLVIDNDPLTEDPHQIPIVFTGWDTTPRHLRRGTILKGFNPQSFAMHLEQIYLQLSKRKQHLPTQVVVIKSWNEWAEGNVIEPDTLWGDALLNQFLLFTQKFTK